MGKTWIGIGDEKWKVLFCLGKNIKSIKKGGIKGTAEKTISYIHTAKIRAAQEKYVGKIYKDILFINGCDYTALPHPHVTESNIRWNS